jgi:DNA-binding MarR family transcriptional regulator
VEGQGDRALADPFRVRILNVITTTDAPPTAAELADQLEAELGRTAYHVRVLEDAGYILEEIDLEAPSGRRYRPTQKGRSALG